MNPVLIDPPYNTCAAQSQSSFDQKVFSKEDMEDGVRLMDSVMAPKVHWHSLRSGLIFEH